jgi:hypothetical protein
MACNLERKFKERVPLFSPESCAFSFANQKNNSTIFGAVTFPVVLLGRRTLDSHIQGRT